MSNDAQPSRSIQDQVWGVVDPKGETRALINAAVHAPGVPGWMGLLGADVAEDWERLRSEAGRYGSLMTGIEAAVEVLVPRGWAVMLMPTEAIKEAVRLVREGEENSADELLAAQWDGDGAWRTKRVCERVRVMGAADPELHRMFQERARLLGKAKEHHDEGRYDASIPILLSQMEGIVMDVVPGRKFFTKGNQKADLVDPTQLVSIEASLAALQATYGHDVKATQTAGDLSRHGVAHGRELAYDTRVNSAKTWSVMDALVEWALPKARTEVERRRAERQAANAGNEGVDDRGRRIDDREFSVTRDVLKLLANSAVGWHRQRGSFRDDLVGGVYTAKDFEKRKLPAEPGIHERLGSEGQEVAYWRETASGWILGIALTRKDRGYVEHLYAGAIPPVGLPSDSGSSWSDPRAIPPDWT